MFPKRGEKKDREGRREGGHREKREKKRALGYFELITHSSPSSAKASPLYEKSFWAKLGNTLEVFEFIITFLSTYQAGLYKFRYKNQQMIKL